MCGEFLFIVMKINLPCVERKKVIRHYEEFFFEVTLIDRNDKSQKCIKLGYNRMVKKGNEIKYNKIK